MFRKKQSDLSLYASSLEDTNLSISTMDPDVSHNLRVHFRHTSDAFRLHANKRKAHGIITPLTSVERSALESASITATLNISLAHATHESVAFNVRAELGPAKSCRAAFYWSVQSEAALLLNIA